MSTETAPVRITIAGGGAEAGRHARALRAIDGVALTATDGSEPSLLDALSAPGEAIAFVAPLPELAGLVRRALIAGRHVLVCGGATLSSKQLDAIDDLARRRERTVLIDTGVPGDEQLAFITKMSAGANALWRPRYVRALRTGVAAGGDSLDRLAEREIARVLAVAGGLPSMVSAVAPRVDDESGAAGVAMLTLWLDGGPVARIDVSLLEQGAREELVVACDTRTITLQPLDRQAPMLIQAGVQHRGPKCGGQWAETVSEHPTGEARQRIDVLAETFVLAVREGGSIATNAAAAARAALVWERARASIARDGEIVAVQPEPQAFRSRPVLEVIEGGGRRVAGAVPHLTLVASGSRG